MSDLNNQTAVAAVAAEQVELPTSPIFAESAPQLLETLNRYAEQLAAHGDKFVSVGILDDGSLDPEIYSESMRPVFHVLRSRNEEGKPVKAVAVYPAPTLEAVIADPKGRDWLDRIVRTQLAKSAIATIRDSGKAPSEVAESLPTQAADYWTVTSTASDFLTGYDATYRNVIAAISKAIPSFGRVKLNKAEFRRALESVAYANALYPQFEQMKQRDGTTRSLFAKALETMIAAIPALNAQLQAEGKDTVSDAALVKWLETRDSAAIGKDNAEEEFDLDSINI